MTLHAHEALLILTVATAGILPDSIWNTVSKGSLGVSWPVNLPREQLNSLYILNSGFMTGQAITRVQVKLQQNENPCVCFVQKKYRSSNSALRVNYKRSTVRLSADIPPCQQRIYGVCKMMVGLQLQKLLF